MTKPAIDVSAITLPSPTGTLAFADYQGARAIVLLGNQKTTDVVLAMVRQLQADPRTAEIPILQVAHLVGVPRVVRRVPEREIRKRITALHAEMTDRGLTAQDAQRLLTIGLDWEGEVTKQFDFSSSDAHPVAAVLDEHLSVVMSTRNPNAIAELLVVLGSMTSADPLRSTT